MKNIALDIVVAVIFMALSSCHQEIDGGGDPLILSREVVAIPPEGGEATVTILQKRRAWIEAATLWDNNNAEGQTIFKNPNEDGITHDWFSTWYKIENGYEVIYVRLTPNETGFKRRVDIGLQDMNVFGGFNVYQDPL